VSFCVADDASWQAGGCFARATRGAIGDHGEHDAMSPCRLRARAARLDPMTRAPLDNRRGSADPMKKGESLRPIVLY
jgi:hypothetical protein